LSEAGCPCCGCRAAGGERAHAIAAALRDDDLDRAMTLGLLDGDDAPPVACAECAPDCRARIESARAGRTAALAARERHRARALRLERRERERAERRAAASVATADMARDGDDIAPAAVPGLPPAAAAALARARARAAGKSG
jgi:hypothetical protein